MENERILQGNKIIAEFMGYPKDEQGRGYIIPDLPHVRATVLCSDKYLHFHSDWDWIMPVVEKIESLGYYVSIMKSNVICCKDKGISPIFEKYFDRSVTSAVKLETTFLAVTEFINFYNKAKWKEVVENMKSICTHRTIHTNDYHILVEEDGVVILGYGNNCDGDIVIQSVLEEDYDLKCYFYLCSVITKEVLDSFLKKEITYLDVINTSNEMYLVKEMITLFRSTYKITLSDIPNEYLPLKESFLP